MVPLVPELRKILENRIPDARQSAEEAARAILTTLAVFRADPFPTLTPDQRRLRNALRAKARQLGGGSQHDGFEPLVEELAYQQWHRMVFARFLAENNLLMHPSGVPVTLHDCTDLAGEEGEVDAWAVAAKYAALMLPGIFRPEDPETQVRLAPEGQQKLEAILNSLPSVTFLADDSLGWMYQFWQSRKKDEINKSERKIGGADIAPVTQLFTEDYMVQFLLENTLGAWWAIQHPESPLLNQWEYIRLKGNGTPAAGKFSGWPNNIAEISIVDPCCGSGHFLVAAFDMLRQMRMEEERLDGIHSGDAVLRDNIYGFEIDPRCSQIVFFALSLLAWKRDGYRSLPPLNIVCTGLPVKGQMNEWIGLAGQDNELKRTIVNLYQVFSDAPNLGSLIDPDQSHDGPLFSIEYSSIRPRLEKAIQEHGQLKDQESVIFGLQAYEIFRASDLLSRKYTLVVTNVPFLTRGKQDRSLADFCSSYYPDSSSDLATTFIERIQSLTSKEGTLAIVSPQNWLFLGSYKKLREKLIKNHEWNGLVLLGPAAFQNMNWWAAKTLLAIITLRSTNTLPLNNTNKEHDFFGIDASKTRITSEKPTILRDGNLTFVSQIGQLSNPDCRIILSQPHFGDLLSKYADSYWGLGTGDYSRYGRCFWEMPSLTEDWIVQLSTVVNTVAYGGREHILFWQEGKGDLVNDPGAYIRATHIWGKMGVLVSQMGRLPVTLYTGEAFDTNCSPIIPKNPDHLAAIWYFCSSDEFAREVRKLDQKLNVTNATLVKVPFDLDYWQKVANDHGPLPEPSSNDPTQWIFDGNPVHSNYPLLVTITRLLGFHWPQQNPDDLTPLADEDGILCLPSVFGEPAAVDCLRLFLNKTYGSTWSPMKQAELISQSGSPGKSLEDWLRDDFFAQHSKLFHNRPFIWHIWDGRKDGFSALVNYHKLTTENLDRLIYTYLGDWINFQRARRDHGEPGADGRLVAALQLQEKLKLIREGEPPYDIYVRWKSLAEQPIGWDPDLNDGVRINIRPFVTAGVLRAKFNINWNKDRGKNPDGSERLNDLHYTRAEKLAARK